MSFNGNTYFGDANLRNGLGERYFRGGHFLDERESIVNRLSFGV
jgi:hypothetical protein